MSEQGKRLSDLAKLLPGGFDTRDQLDKEGACRSGLVVDAGMRRRGTRARQRYEFMKERSFAGVAARRAPAGVSRKTFLYRLLAGVRHGQGTGRGDLVAWTGGQ